MKANQMVLFIKKKNLMSTIYSRMSLRQLKGLWGKKGSNLTFLSSSLENRSGQLSTRHLYYEAKIYRLYKKKYDDLGVLPTTKSLQSTFIESRVLLSLIKFMVIRGCTSLLLR